MRKKRRKPVRRWIILILITAVVITWIVRYFGGDKVSVSIARMTEFEDKVSVSAVYVRNESVYNCKSGGMLLGRVSANTKVPAGTHVATLYASGLDDRAKQEIEEINSRLDTFEQLSNSSFSFSSDINTSENEIKKGVEEIVKLSQKRDLTGLEVVKINLDEAASPKAGKALEETINSLTARRSTIEQSIAAAGEKIYASQAGIFIPFADGYENVFSAKNYNDITVNQITDCLNTAKNIKTNEVINYNAGDSVCKTVGNSEWMLACVLKKDMTYGIKKDMQVKIRILSADDQEANAKVIRLESDDNENFICVLDVGDAVKNAYSDRVAEIEIIKKSYNGLSLPVNALRFDDEGMPGVFINSNGIARFKKINLLYSDDSVAIAENINAYGMIRMYDSVILDRDGIYDGKTIKQ